MCQKSQKTSNKINDFVLIGIQVSIVLIYILLKSFNVTSFSDRIMGGALLYGTDITQKVNTYYIILFALIPGIAIVISQILKHIFDEKDKKTIKYMNIIAILGIVSTILNFLDTVQKQQSIQIYLTVALLGSINFIIILSKMFCKILKRKFDFEDIKWAIISAIPLIFLEMLIIHKFSGLATKKLTLIICYIINYCALYLIINLKIINKKVLKKAYLFVILAPLMEVIYLEIYNILNQHNIFIVHKLRYEIMIYLILGLISIIYYVINRKKNIKFYYTKYYYPILILAVSAILVSLPMKIIVDTDFFESANHGIGVYEFFTFGKIPIIENFDAHMMNNQIFGIIYGFLNNDIQGAMFCQYGVYKTVIFYILIYYLLKKIFSRDVAFLITMFLPVQCDIGLESSGMAILAILTLINAYKKQNISSYLLYWISLAFLCIWQLDIGYGISIATVIVLIYMLIQNKKQGKEIKIKNALITFCSVIGIAGIIFIGLCLIKNVNPITRLIEFLKLSMSNVNWAYPSMGENTGLAYVFAYIIMPLIVISTLIYEAFFANRKNSKMKIILLSMGLFYILNMQRGMVRHSLLEGRSVQILNMGMLYISIFMYHNFFHRDEKKFIAFYISIILISGALTIQTSGRFESLFEGGINKYLKYEIQDEVYVEKIERIQLSEKMKNEYKNLKVIMDEILEDDETYVDLSNQNLLYALLKKKMPVYVNQSPGLLSGEKTQELFIEEIKNNNVPVLIKAKNKLLSENIDGIENDFRYYLVGEYVYQKYTPVAIVDGYEIWIENSMLDDKINKLKQVQNDALKIISKEQYIELEQEQIDLKEIARIWGEYDVKKDEHQMSQNIAENIEVDNTESKITTNFENTDKTQGNYLDLKIQSTQKTELTINLYQNEQKICSYIINVEQGEHNYRIRVSGIYEWFKTNINSIGLSTKEKIQVTNIELCKADKIEK